MAFYVKDDTRAVETFVQILDRGLARRQQLVFTASTGPALLDELPARLTSRLSAGLVVALSPLSPQSRLAFHILTGAFEW